MTNTTIDWRDHTVHGYFEAQVPADVLGEDLRTVVGSATIEITAEAGELAGVIVAFTVDPGQDATFVGGTGDEDMWFEPHAGERGGAYAYAAAIAAAAAAPEATEVPLTAWANDTLPDLVPVHIDIVTEPDEFNGVYLTIRNDDATWPAAAVLVSQPDAAHLTALIHAAVDYLTAHGAN